MLGVVIWSCQETGRAIVWCADHRDLAHYDGASRSGSRVGVQVGDLVEVSLMTEKAVRRCTGIKMIEAGYLPDIAENLKGRTRGIAAA